MRLIQSISGSGWLALLVAWSIMSHYGSAYAQTAPTPAVRQELLKVRQRIWESYFRNDQTQLQQSIGGDFLTINPNEEHWQNRDEFLAGAEAFARHNGKLVRLTFPRTEIQDFGNVAVLYSLVQITMETEWQTGVLRLPFNGSISEETRALGQYRSTCRLRAIVRLVARKTS